MNNRENEEKAAACAAFFSDHKQYDRVFKDMRRKWRKHGRAAGIIKIENPSVEERRAVEGFFGKGFSENTIQFGMKEFETALQETRFRGVTLEELLCAYFQEELITNQEEKRLDIQKKKDFFQELQKRAVQIYGQESASAIWLDHMVNQKKYGYRVILAEYAKEPEKIQWQIGNVCRAMELLGREKGIRLAVLGAEVTRNPHEFDRNTVSGKLLIQGLSCINNDMACKSAEDILMLYYASGIKPDEISSFTTVYGVHLYTEAGEHPAYKGFIEMREPFVVTLSNLTRIKEARVRKKRVYVIENQMVFSHLCGVLQDQEAALVCTSGQIKTASWMLLDLLCESGCRLYYCGDLDPEGISIAEKALMRNGSHVQLWHMSKKDYDLSVSDERISEESLSKLGKITHPDLAEVRDAILKKKRAGYQERLIEMLHEDIVRSPGT